ncbi:MAG: hypothetical protein M1818_008028 [Claussenomyces sp. TS43310]|nr:MAG: hypothetical protein M1818_008028 [Claussenomyces sp. TS43310]
MLMQGMYHSGLGGGGFQNVRDANGEHKCIDFRETAPAAAYEDMYKNNGVGSRLGGLASGVPGEIAGYEYTHQQYGVLPWEEIFKPAISVARNGFPVTEDLIRYMNFAIKERGWNFLAGDPIWAQDFAPHGSLLDVGEIMTRKRYADTLEIISRKGAKAFYEGPIAEATIRAVRAANGTMSMEDLAGYEVTVRNAISIDYRGYRVFSCAAPSSGSVVLSALKTIEGYDMSDKNTGNLNTHRFVEALRFAYAAHNKLGDPGFFEGMDLYEAMMVNATTAEGVRDKISDHHTLNVSEYDPEMLWSPDTAGTSHVSAADASGMAVTGTTTVNLLFGSQLMVPETGKTFLFAEKQGSDRADHSLGVIMNDEMNDFSIPGVSNAFGFVPSPINYIRPGKRPLSSITPVIVEYANGEPYIITGAAGGSRIPTATIQTLWHILDHNMTMAEALRQPRLHDQLLPNEVIFEYPFDNSTVEFMKGRGHNVSWVQEGLSAAQGIRRLPNGTFEAAGEPRQKNSAGFAI